MLALWVMLWVAWSLTVWYQVVFWLPARKSIVGCEHRHGKIKPCCPDQMGNPTALVWFCDACALQFPLQVIRGSKRGERDWNWTLPPERVPK